MCVISHMLKRMIDVAVSFQQSTSGLCLQQLCKGRLGGSGRRMDDFWCSQGVELDASAWHSRCLSAASSPASPTKEKDILLDVLFS